VGASAVGKLTTLGNKSLATEDSPSIWRLPSDGQQRTETLAKRHEGKLRLERRNGAPKIFAPHVPRGQNHQVDGEKAVPAARKLVLKPVLGRKAGQPALHREPPRSDQSRIPTTETLRRGPEQVPACSQRFTIRRTPVER